MSKDNDNRAEGMTSAEAVAAMADWDEVSPQHCTAGEVVACRLDAGNGYFAIILRGEQFKRARATSSGKGLLLANASGLLTDSNIRVGVSMTVSDKTVKAHLSHARKRAEDYAAGKPSKTERSVKHTMS